MIDKNHIRAGLAVLLAFAVPGAQAASSLELAGSKAICSGLFDTGAQYVEVDGSNEKFTEYRDARSGLQVDHVGVSVQGAEKPYFFDFEARNVVSGLQTPASRDASYKVSAGRYGKYKFRVELDRTPHNFGRGRLLLNGAGTGNLGIADSVQAVLQANEQTRQERGTLALPDTTGEDAIQQRLVRGLVDSSDYTSFRLDREKGSLSGEFDLGGDAKTWVKFSEENRKGFRQMGSGTYERYAQGAAGITHTEDQFVAEGFEIAEPIDYKTQVMNAGVGVYKKGWSADLEYTFTEFTQKLRSLVWDNPFRSTDATAVNNLGVPNNANERGRYNRGQLGLPPTSQSHEVAASGSVELPLQSRLTGAVGLALTEQSNMLLPYTLNTAISGVGGAPVNVADPSALPVQRFTGAVRNFTGSLVLNSRPIERLKTALKYRYYNYDNRTDRVIFPGFAAYGESYWRTTKNATTTTNAAVANEVASWNRNTVELSADFEVAEPLTVDVNVFADRWDYKDVRVEETNEYGAGVGFGYHLGHVAKIHGGAKIARRAVDGYRIGNRAENPEAVGLENFNWSDRKRKKANLGVSVSPTEKLSFGVDGSYQKDEYGAWRFGLKQVDSAVAALDVTYEPTDAIDLSFDYSREMRRSKISNAAKDDGFNSASALDDTWVSDNFNPLNYWNDTITENVDTIGLNATVRATEKLDIGASYAFSFTDMEFNQSNPNSAEAAAAGFGNGAKLANGVAQKWPNVVSRLHEARLNAGYKVTKDLTVGGNYLFSRYSLNDFANIGSYAANVSPENTTKYVWTGATDFNYTAHVIGTYVAWKF